MVTSGETRRRWVTISAPTRRLGWSSWRPTGGAPAPSRASGARGASSNTSTARPPARAAGPMAGAAGMGDTMNARDVWTLATAAGLSADATWSEVRDRVKQLRLAAEAQTAIRALVDALRLERDGAVERVRVLEQEVGRLRPTQPEPSGGHGDVWQELIEHIGSGHPLHAVCVERRAVGLARYGQPLQYDDGRDPELDLREELLDAAAYAWRAGCRSLAVELLDIEAGRTSEGRALAAVAMAIVDHARPPLASDVGLAVRLAWVAGRLQRGSS